jgi:glycerophosphoryl diester phosphodiesterase
VVQRYAARCFLDIELKVVGLEQHALELIATHAPKGPHVISSFLPEVLRELRAVNPAARTGFITEKQSTLGKWEALDVAAIIPQHKLVSASLVADVHAAGRQVMVWTVNDAREMRAMADMSVDAIISDDTQLLCRTFGVRAR